MYVRVECGVAEAQLNSLCVDFYMLWKVAYGLVIALSVFVRGIFEAKLSHTCCYFSLQKKNNIMFMCQKSYNNLTSILHTFALLAMLLT